MRQDYWITDAHCHVYPDAIAEKAVQGTSRFYDVAFALDGKESTLRLAAGEAGVDHCVIQSVATAPHQVSGINAFIARTAAAGAGFYTGLGTLHPDSPSPEEDVTELLRLRLHGVKLHPDIQQFHLDDEKCFPLYALCEAHHLPLLIHTGDRRYDFSNPDRLLRMLRRYPALTVVGAHLGGWSVWEEAAEKLQGVPNLYFDCSSCFYWLKKDAVRKIIERLGTDRVLFGTDYPMWKPKAELDTFFALGFSPEENRAMLSANAEKVFSIETPARRETGGGA